MRTNNNETRVTKAISMINRKKATWEDVSQELGISVNYIQAMVREHYKVKKNYNNLLAKARENKKEKKKRSKAPIGEVILTETGYILEKGASMLEEALDIYIPSFCIIELEKLSDTYVEAIDFLTRFYATYDIKDLNLRGREKLLVEPIAPVKDRTKGIVAAAIELASRGYKVRLLTNSWDVEVLANAQNCKSIDVMRVQSQSKKVV